MKAVTKFAVNAHGTSNQYFAFVFQVYIGVHQCESVVIKSVKQLGGIVCGAGDEVPGGE